MVELTVWFALVSAPAHNGQPLFFPHYFQSEKTCTAFVKEVDKRSSPADSGVKTTRGICIPATIPVVE